MLSPDDGPQVRAAAHRPGSSSHRRTFIHQLRGAAALAYGLHVTVDELLLCEKRSMFGHSLTIGCQAVKAFASLLKELGQWCEGTRMDVLLWWITLYGLRSLSYCP